MSGISGVVNDGEYTGKDNHSHIFNVFTRATMRIDFAIVHKGNVHWDDIL